MIKWICISLLAPTIIVSAYFMLNQSYNASIKALYFYTMGDYKSAHNLALKAHILDNQNSMALSLIKKTQNTIMAIDFIKQAKTYKNYIKTLQDNKNITKAQKQRIKIMNNIIVEYFNLFPKHINIQKDILQKAQKEFLWHDKLHKAIFK